jgi:hypothetical protein
LLRTGHDPTTAERSFCQAIGTAQQQSAKFWDLRAATSLPRLWREQGTPLPRSQRRPPAHVLGAIPRLPAGRHWIALSITQSLWKAGPVRAAIDLANHRAERANLHKPTVLFAEAQNATQWWQNRETARGKISSFEAAVRANTIAFRGFKQENRSGMLAAGLAASVAACP